MVLKSSGPFICCKNVVADVIACLLVKSGISLQLDDMLEKTGINCSHDVNKKLPRWPFLCCKLVVHVPLDLRIILNLFDKVVHVELAVEWQRDPIDLVVFEACFLTSDQLTDKATVNVGIFIQVTLTKIKSLLPECPTKWILNVTYHCMVRYQQIARLLLNLLSKSSALSFWRFLFLLVALFIQLDIYKSFYQSSKINYKKYR